jgi:hypothetical protein
MQITHTEAHRLIQYDLDHVLNPEKERSLLAHLKECDDCRAYAVEMRRVENKLRQVMNKKWNRHGPLPLSMDSIKIQGGLTRTSQNLFQFRTALISMVLVAFSFIIWQITATSFDASGQIPSTILPVPTPSTLITASLASPTCEWTLHKVEESDTLDSIALQYSVSKQDIMTFNEMDSEWIYESMEIKIPQCAITPTMTAHFPITTLTPKLEPIIDTPG